VQRTRSDTSADYPSIFGEAIGTRFFPRTGIQAGQNEHLSRYPSGKGTSIVHSKRRTAVADAVPSSFIHHRHGWDDNYRLDCRVFNTLGFAGETCSPSPVRKTRCEA
jgi:hypothetical protein